MKNYKHLYEVDADPYENVLTRNIPTVMLRNTLTTNIILSMESFLKASFRTVRTQTKYFSH